MTTVDLAARLNGREYLNEMTKAEENAAKESNLLVVFGASDNLIELRGAINDEAGAYDVTTILISDGELLQDIDPKEIAVLKKHHVYTRILNRRALALKIKALWCAGDGISWTYWTEAVHATFDVMEDGAVYCRGIVIDLKEVR